jgi:ATP-dependent Clp protease ATP-binding subunit ClpC
MKQSALTSEARGFSRRDVDMVTETDVSDVIKLDWYSCNYRIRISSIIKMEDSIHERIIGQRHAVVSVSKAIRRARVGFTRSKSTNCKFYIRWTNWCWKNRINKSFI